MKANVTIKDIADKAGVSLGTASKVINGDPSVKKKNRDAVENAIKELNYIVNKVARSLAHKPLRLGILLPINFDAAIEPMLSGIKSAVDELADFKVSAEYEYFDNYYDDEKVIKCLERFEAENIDGVVLCPSRVVKHSDWIARLKKAGIPTIMLMSDVAQTGRIACVRVDAIMSGIMAADLARLLTHGDDEVAVFIGEKDVTEHQLKAEHFFEQSTKQGVPVAGIYETFDKREYGYQLTKEVLSQNPNLRLIYVATANSLSVCACIHEMGYSGRVRVIATDIVKELRPYVEVGTVVAVLDQHQELQGKTAVNILYKYLSTNELNKMEAKIPPSVLLRNGILSKCNN